MNKGWTYYNHAMVPTCAPHEVPDLMPIKDKSIWKSGGGDSAISQMDYGLGLRI